MPGRRRLALADDLRQQVIQLRHDDQGTEPAEAAIGSVSGRWAEIVGPALAAHTRPDSFADGELAVTADSTAWALRAIEGSASAAASRSCGPFPVAGAAVGG